MSNEFLARHLGPSTNDIETMLSSIGCLSVDEVISKTVPKNILFGNRMALDEGMTERDTLALASSLAAKNILATNFIGQGYYGMLMPSVIQRNILENPVDEPTACAEAMMMAKRANKKNKSNQFLIDINTHPQTITILQTRAKPLGIELIIKDIQHHDFSDCFACLMQYPGTNGDVRDLTADITRAKDNDVLTIVACDLLALTLLKTPAEMGG